MHVSPIRVDGVLSLSRYEQMIRNRKALTDVSKLVITSSNFSESQRDVGDNRK
jgi:hypothetical protein